VLYLTLANLVITTFSAPFRGAIEARQAMGQVAAGEVIRTLAPLIRDMKIVTGAAHGYETVFLLEKP